MPTFIDELLKPGAYPHPVEAVRLIETHISWVLLTGPFAYKIKKPVDFGFLDFSTLEKRKSCCEAELELNRRFAAELYLDVVAITRTRSGACVAGDGATIDYAVKMRQFPDDAQMDERLRADRVTADDIAHFAEDLARVHAQLPKASHDAEFGTPALVWAPVEENFEQIAGTPFARTRAADLGEIGAWSRARHRALEMHFEARHANGFVRECHGDLHLSNLVWLAGRAVAFDCIEFNARLRWIDVVSDAAFLAMDLDTRGRADLAHVFLDRYFEQSGDYDGARALDFYLGYRTMVRAKVAALRARGAPEIGGDDDPARAEARRFALHVDYALGLARSKRPLLMLMCGVSGSGKSWLAERLVPRLPAIRVRSDVERKRLHGLAPAARAAAAPQQGLYADAVTDATYARLAQCADALLEGGVDALVDATFLSAPRRAQFRALAERAGARFCVLHCSAPESVLLERVRARRRAARDPSDADETILRAQLATGIDLTPSDHVLTVDTSREIDWPALLAAIAAH